MSGPSSVPPPRLPGLAKCSPTRYALQVRESSWLRGFVARNGISQTELSECWELSTTSVQRILRGERPLHSKLLKMLPSPYRERAVLEHAALENAAA